MTLRAHDAPLPENLQDLVFLHDRLYRRIDMIREMGRYGLADTLQEFCFTEIVDVDVLIEEIRKSV